MTKDKLREINKDLGMYWAMIMLCFINSLEHADNSILFLVLFLIVSVLRFVFMFKKEDGEKTVHHTTGQDTK